MVFKLMKSNNVKLKPGWNQVAYVRHSKDPAMPLLTGGKGGDFGPRQVDTVTVTTRSGEKYEIPVNKKGTVPEEYLHARFLDVAAGAIPEGTVRSVPIDLARDAVHMHIQPAKGFTPDELVETGWWQHPQMSDIYGVDDTSMAGSIELLMAGAAATLQAASKEIVMRMPKDSAKRAWDVLKADFTAGEIKKAAKGGLVIMEGDPGVGASGSYAPRVHGSSIATPIIVLKRGWDEDTLVHEFTHHLRHTDVTRGGLTRTPFRLDDDGRVMWGLEGSAFNSARNLEEAATVTEATVRTREPCQMPTGYYDYTGDVHGKTWKERYNYDRGILAGDKPRRGRYAEKRVASKFDDTAISHLRIYHPGQSAASYYKERRDAGTLPVAQKPKKAPSKPKTAIVPVSGPVPVSANRRARAYRRY